MDEPIQFPVYHFRWYVMSDRSHTGKFSDTTKEKRACSVCQCRIDGEQRYAVASTEVAHHFYINTQTLCERHASEYEANMKE